MNLFILIAQNQAKFLFSNEKIYTVLSVVLIIWLGIIIALLRIEKRLNKIEKELQQLDDKSNESSNQNE